MPGLFSYDKIAQVSVGLHPARLTLPKFVIPNPFASLCERCEESAFALATINHFFFEAAVAHPSFATVPPLARRIVLAA